MCESITFEFLLIVYSIEKFERFECIFFKSVCVGKKTRPSKLAPSLMGYAKYKMKFELIDVLAVKFSENFKFERIALFLYI